MKQITITNALGDTFSFDNTRNGSIINRTEGFEYGDTIEVIQPLPGRSGSIFIDSDYKDRRISWEGQILGTDKDNAIRLRRDMIQAIPQGELLTVKFTTFDDLKLQTLAYLRKLRMEYSRQFQEFLIEMRSPDWRFYSQTLQQPETAITSSVGGMSLPTALPASLTNSSGTPPLSLTNSGNEKSPAIYKIYGAGTTFTVTNNTTGESFTINQSLAAGEVITVDTLNRTVIQGSNQNVYGNFSGDFPQISPGDNEIRFNVVSGSDSNTKLVIEFRSAYRGV